MNNIHITNLGPLAQRELYEICKDKKLQKLPPILLTELAIKRAMQRMSEEINKK
jgi:hypothetical protein